MVTVGQHAEDVEVELARGRIACPGCPGGRLRPWGWARRRGVRQDVADAGAVLVHRPRRSRCGGCGATHVLLPEVLAARRADGAAVIALAIEAKVVGGHGHRVIARRLGRPVGTVRGWLRSFSWSAEAITTAFTTLVARHAPDAAALWPAPSGAGAARALSVLGAWARALSQRLGVVEVAWWQAGLRTCGGWLFTAPWWSDAGQHELTRSQVGLEPGAWC